MTNKEIVKKLYEVVFNGHDVKRSPEFIRENYIQHNPGTATGLKGFMDAFEEHFKRQPYFHTEIKHLIAEGDYVVVHAHAKGKPDDTGAAVVDIYRMEDGKMAEHWDILQPIPEKTVSGNEMV